MAEVPTWKDDFPISWSDDNYVTRREFTKSLVLVSCATFCANGALVAMGAIERRKRGEKLEPRKIGQVHEVPVGAARVFEYPEPGEPCLLVRLAEDRFVAYSQKCTHLGCPVMWQRQKQQLACPCHQGFFAVEDGKVLAGPPPRPLPKIELERKGDELWATGIKF